MLNADWRAHQSTISIQPSAFFAFARMIPTMRPARALALRCEWKISANVFVQRPAPWICPAGNTGRLDLVTVGESQIEIETITLTRCEPSVHRIRRVTGITECRRARRGRPRHNRRRGTAQLRPRDQPDRIRTIHASHALRPMRRHEPCPAIRRGPHRPHQAAGRRGASVRSRPHARRLRWLGRRSPRRRRRAASMSNHGPDRRPPPSPRESAAAAALGRASTPISRATACHSPRSSRSSTVAAVKK